MLAADINRFWRKVDHTGECWCWSAANTKGYGSFAVGSRTDGTKRRVLAHRVMWEITHGPIPAGMNVLHRCDNPPCVRPSHLFLGTQLENIADMIAKSRNHRGERTGGVKLDVERVRLIRRRADRGEGHDAIASDLRISRSCVSMIAERKRWRHVD